MNLKSKMWYEMPGHCGGICNEEDIKDFIRRIKCYDKNKLLGKDFIVISIKDLDEISGFEE